jgi:thiaminase/transcriptional activator TenA
MDVFDRLRAAAASDWALYVEHEFVRQLQARRLPEAAFRAYLVQDYLFSSSSRAPMRSPSTKVAT